VKLEQRAAAERGGGNNEQLLMQGPKHIDELSAAIGGKKTRIYGVVHSITQEGPRRSWSEQGYQSAHRERGVEPDLCSAIPARSASAQRSAKWIKVMRP
jgi:hypothetical protein